MIKRFLVPLVTAVLLTGALAQDATPLTSLDTRLSILETRVGRLEADLSRLSGMPTQLARIEEKITALTEKASGNSGILQSLGMAVVMAVLSSVIAYQMGKRGK